MQRGEDGYKMRGDGAKVSKHKDPHASPCKMLPRYKNLEVKVKSA